MKLMLQELTYDLTLITSWAARPPMKALTGAKSPWAV